MKFSIVREALLSALQKITGVVERRQTLPVLANVLFNLTNNTLTLTATDLEIELSCSTPVENMSAEGRVTVPARKLLDICKSFPEQAVIDLWLEEQRMIVRSGRSRFVLSTLPAEDFPHIGSIEFSTRFSITSQQLLTLFEYSHFAIAQQDIRYYLNGLLFEVNHGTLRCVATDGHRLAMATLTGINQEFNQQVILPRKAIMELLRLLTKDEIELTVNFSTHHWQLVLADLTFTTRLIDGKFPPYDKVIPKGGDKILTVNKDILRQALQRVSILSNEKHRGVRLHLKPQHLVLAANNPEQEEAEEEIEADYQQDELEIGFNVTYLLDVLNTLNSDQVKMTFTQATGSALLEGTTESNCLYVVMPMRI